MIDMSKVFMAVLILGIIVGVIYFVVFFLAKKDFGRKKDKEQPTCPNCGTALISGKKFCTNCGAEMDVTEE